MKKTDTKIGIIGTGDMGSLICQNLLSAKYPVIIFDRQSSRMQPLVEKGASAVSGIENLVAGSDVIITSLPSSDIWINVMRESIIPATRRGQVIIDTGTVRPYQTREIASQLKASGVYLLDTPVSGGTAALKNLRLLVFAGGDQQVFEKFRPIIEAFAGTEYITYCGPSGSGQVVKGVNQLMMALSNAAYLEAIAFGTNQGISAETIQKAITDQDPMRKKLWQTAQRIAEKQGNEIDYKFRELPYFIDDAEHAAFSLPMTKALFDFCKDGQRVTIQDKRHAPAFWHELTRTSER